MMEIRPLTPADYPGMIAVHASLHIAWPERPRTPEAWDALDHSRSPKVKLLRWAAVEDEQVVGFASCRQGPMEYPPKSCYINVEVRADRQRRGIGEALYEQVIAGAADLAPTALRADAFTHLPQGYRFLQQRGFREVFRETPVSLDAAAFDPSPYAGLEARLEREDILIKTLPELADDPERDRKVYEIYWDTAESLPTEGDPLKRPPFEEWVEMDLKDASMLQDAFFVALCGDEYIGVREVGRYGSSDTLVGGFLGVRPDFRKRGVGLALHLRGILYAREHGCRWFKTCTAVQNAAMQALFNRLGYVREAEWQQCQKDL